MWITSSCLPHENSFNYYCDSENVAELLGGIEALTLHLANPDSQLPSFNSMVLTNLNLVQCHFVNALNNPAKSILNLSTVLLNTDLYFSLHSIRKVHLIGYAIHYESFIQMLDYMPRLEEVTLIDVVLCSSLDEERDNINNERQSPMWFDLAGAFNRTWFPTKQLLIGFTKGSVISLPGI
jgi:hypothetical protein